jgi:hypothetical protein
METHNSFDEQFVFTGKAKTLSLIGIVIGLIAIAFGFLYNHGEHAERTFSNLLLMSYYFACVCLAGVFFCAIQYIAQAGWSASLLRVPQAFAKTLPIAGLILVVVAAAGLLTHHTIIEDGKEVSAPYLYKHWASHGLSDPKSEHYDPLIAGKSAFLNVPFFFVFIIGLLFVYSIFGSLFNKYSNNEDTLGGMQNYNKSFKISAIFLVIFGFTFPIFAFDAIMSLEAHWFSTMFGWYNLAAMWVSGLAVITLVLLLLKDAGYFTWVNVNHFHNLGQLIFGFSIFWTYVWFAQFFLIWYANMPEETVYFYKRWEPEFKPWFWLNIVMNFVAPLFILMSRDSKRALTVLKVACIIVILGHWLDYYMMIMPGTVEGEGRGFGIEEIGIFLGFAGLFTFLVLGALSRYKSLVPKKHPFLQESLHHHI